MNKLIIGLLLTLVPGAAHAQSGAMAPLAMMVGRWEGEGWQLTRDGRAASAIVETVEPRLEGALLIVEGIGRADVGTPRERIVHHAFGVISYDATRSVHRMRAYRSDGNVVESDVAVKDNIVTWGFEDPRAGRIRYRTTFTADEWHEIGELSRDGGATWMQFMEMRLRRVR